MADTIITSDVVLALNFEGGSYNDLSDYHHAVVSSSGATITGSGSRTSDSYASAAYLLDSSAGPAKLEYTFDWSLIKTGDITVEFDVYIQDAAAVATQTRFLSSPYVGIYADTHDATRYKLHEFLCGNMFGAVYPTYGAWHHVAFVVHAGGLLRSFLDGVQFSASSAYTDNRSAFYDLSNTLYLLKKPGSSGPGIQLDNVVITQAAKYTAGFTPPGAVVPAPTVVTGAVAVGDVTPAGALTASQFGGVLNLRFSGVGSTDFPDSSPYTRGVTRVGTPVVAISSGGPAGSFDGSGDYLTVPGSTDFAFGTGDFAIRLWFSTTDSNCMLVDNYVSGASGWQVYVLSTGQVQLYRTAGLCTSPLAYNDGGWHHLAITRADTALRMFVDGVQVDSVTDSSNFFSVASVLAVGAQVAQPNPSYDYVGYLDDVEIYKGVALHTAGFTPPSREQGIVVSDSLTVADITVSGTATTAEVIYGSGDAQLDPVTSNGTIEEVPPTPMTGGATFDVTVSGTAFVPAILTAEVTLPSITVESAGSIRTPTGAEIVLPTLTATSQCGAQAGSTLPRLTVSAQATTVQLAQVVAVLPALTVLAAGRAANQAGAMGYLPSLTAAAQSGHQATITLPGLSAAAHVVSGVVARVQGTLPRITAYATGYRDATASVAITLPAIIAGQWGRAAFELPRMVGAASGRPVLAATTEAYVVNMNQPLDDNPRNNFESKNLQVTRYTNWPFFQVVRMGDQYFGVAADGLYELGGATDDGAEIAWTFETCKTDFKDAHRKTVASAYIGGQTGGSVAYTLRSGDDADRMYEYVTTKTTQKRNHRQKFGLGRRVRYYSFGLTGEGTAAIDSIEFELTTTTRRV